MSDTTTTDSEPQTEPVHDPGPDFKAKVREVLEEILPDFLTKEPEPDVSREPSKPRSLRQEESDMEHLVEKVLGKLKSAEPPRPRSSLNLWSRLHPGHRHASGVSRP